MTPGGGGYGHPYTRDAAAVLADVRNGWVSLEAARREYGVVVTWQDHDFSLDETATSQLRAVGTSAAS